MNFLLLKRWFQKKFKSEIVSIDSLILEFFGFKKDLGERLFLFSNLWLYSQKIFEKCSAKKSFFFEILYILSQEFVFTKFIPSNKLSKI